MSEIFEHWKALILSQPEKFRDPEMKIYWDIDGSTWLMKVGEKAGLEPVSALPEQISTSSLKISCNQSTLQQLSKRELSLGEAFHKEELKYEGNIAGALKFNAIWTALVEQK